MKEKLIRWFLTRVSVQNAFIQERDEQIAKERGKWILLAQKDFQETMQEDIDKQAEELAQNKLSELLSIVKDEDVIALKGRTIYLGGEAADSQRISNLKAEADFFMASELWKVLNETPKALAERAMFMDDGTLENQLLKGRAILFTLATQKKVIDTLQSYELSTPKL